MCPSGTARSTPATARVSPNDFSSPVASMASGAPAVVMGLLGLRLPVSVSVRYDEMCAGTERRPPSFADAVDVSATLMSCRAPREPRRKRISRASGPRACSRAGARHHRPEAATAPMCRLLGWATRTPVTLHGLLGDDDLRRLHRAVRSARRRLGHRPLRPRTAPRCASARTPPARGDDFALWARATRYRPGAGAPALGDLGLGGAGSRTRTRSPTAGVAFAHNGSMLAAARPRRAGSPRRSPGCATETTASERYVRALISRAGRGDTPDEAVPDGRRRDRPVVDPQQPELPADDAVSTPPPDELLRLLVCCRYGPDGSLVYHGVRPTPGCGYRQHGRRGRRLLERPGSRLAGAGEPRGLVGGRSPLASSALAIGGWPHR